MNKGNILIIDDEDAIREILSQLLNLEGYKTFTAITGLDGLEVLSKEEIHLVISDVRLPDKNGIELVSSIKEINPLCEIILLTAYGTIQDGVQAIKNGAFDYITKGDEDNKILPLTEKAIEKAKLKSRIKILESKISERYSFASIIGRSQILKDAVDLAHKVADTSAPVLLQGETGTGKEIFAQAIHYASRRRTKEFVALNCCAFAHDLLESEMFGYKAGAFTGAVKNKKGLFEEAHEGTLFLDEIGEMDITLQAKLLRAIETNSFIKPGDTKPTNIDIRIIAATNRNLDKAILEGNFRKDLYYRIGVMKIEIPPLRDRREDIPLLTENFVYEFSEKLNRNISSIDPGFIEKLKNYDFPGNVRELKNIIERAVILASGNTLKADSLPKEFRQTEYVSLITDPGQSSATLDELEKQYILSVLGQAGGNKPKAAEILGIGMTTLYRKLQSYGL